MSTVDNNQGCELRELCGFYWDYQDYPQVQSRCLVEKYCEVESGSSECRRISYFRTHGENPPVNMSPEGDLISGSPAEIPLP